MVPPCRQHDCRERRQQPVDQRRQPLRLVLQRLGNGGEAAHVAEQDGQRLALAAEAAAARGRGKPLDQRRREILREGARDAAPHPPLGGIVARACAAATAAKASAGRDRRDEEAAEPQQQEAAGERQREASRASTAVSQPVPRQTAAAASSAAAIVHAASRQGKAGAMNRLPGELSKIVAWISAPATRWRLRSVNGVAKNPRRRHRRPAPTAGERPTMTTRPRKKSLRQEFVRISAW